MHTLSKVEVNHYRNVLKKLEDEYKTLAAQNLERLQKYQKSYQKQVQELRESYEERILQINTAHEEEARKKQMHFEGILDSLRAETAEKRKFEKKQKQTLKLLTNQLKAIQGFEKDEIVSLHDRNAKLVIEIKKLTNENNILKRLQAQNQTKEMKKLQNKVKALQMDIRSQKVYHSQQLSVNKADMDILRKECEEKITEIKLQYTFDKQKATQEAFENVNMKDQAETPKVF